MKSLIASAALAALTAVPAAAATLSGATGYGLTDSNDLVVFDDLADLSSMRTVKLSGPKLSGLVYRPVTGDLFGYSTTGKADGVFAVNTASGALTNTGAGFGDGVGIRPGAKIGFDFNNVLDAARVVSTKEDNLVWFPSDTASMNPNAGNVIRATDLYFADGRTNSTGAVTPMDANAGKDPAIFANAYTNAVDGMTATSTLQFALDANTNALVNLANNEGTLTTVATVTYMGEELDFTDQGGMEILSESEGDNTAIAALNVKGMKKSQLFSIDLMTGKATLLGDAGGKLIGFAGQTAKGGMGEQPAAVPLPASAVLLIAGIAGLGIARRRRSA